MTVSSISLSGGVLAGGASCAFGVDVQAVSGGDQVNTTDPVTSSNGGTGGTATATVTVLLPDLAIAKSHVGSFHQTQAGAAYTISVSNVGQATTTALVTVTDTLPAGLTATAIGGVGWECAALPALSCTRGDGVDPGTSFPDLNVTVNVGAHAPASVTNSATVSGGGETNTANDTANDVTTILPASDLTITKTHGGAAFTPGQTGANYTLTVSNVGSGATFGTVTVTDTLPNVPNPLVPTAITGTGWTCDLPTLTCTRSDVLAVNASYPPITVTVNVPANIQPNVTNTATVSGGGEFNTANDTATDPTHIGAPLQLSSQLINLQVIRGGTTSTVLDVESSSGLGAITFACSGLPAGASCSFNPSSVTQVSSLVTMTVTAAATASSTPQASGRTPPLYVAALPLLALWPLLWMVSNRKRRMALALCFATSALAFLLGCGGDNHPAAAVLPTPVTVTATSASTGTSATTTVNLTVL